MQNQAVAVGTISVICVVILSVLLVCSLRQQWVHRRKKSTRKALSTRRKLMLARTFTIAMGLGRGIAAGLQPFANTALMCTLVSKFGGLFYIWSAAGLYTFYSIRLHSACNLPSGREDGFSPKFKRRVKAALNISIAGVFIFAIVTAYYNQGELSTSDGSVVCLYKVKAETSATVMIVDMVLGSALLFLFIHKMYTLPEATSNSYTAIVQRTIQASIISQFSTFMYTAFLIFVSMTKSKSLSELVGICGNINVTINCLAVWYCFGALDIRASGSSANVCHELAAPDFASPTSPTPPECNFPSVNVNRAIDNHTVECTVRGNTEGTRQVSSPTGVQSKASRELTLPKRPKPIRNNSNWGWLVKVRVWGLTRVTEGTAENRSSSVSQLSHMQSNATALPVLDALDKKEEAAHKEDGPHHGSQACLDAKAKGVLERSAFAIKKSGSVDLLQVLADKGKLEGRCDSKRWKYKAEDIQINPIPEQQQLKQSIKQSQMKLRPGFAAKKKKEKASKLRKKEGGSKNECGRISLKKEEGGSSYEGRGTSPTPMGRAGHVGCRRKRSGSRSSSRSRSPARVGRGLDEADDDKSNNKTNSPGGETSNRSNSFEEAETVDASDWENQQPGSTTPSRDAEQLHGECEKSRSQRKSSAEEPQTPRSKRKRPSCPPPKPPVQLEARAAEMMAVDLTSDDRASTKNDLGTVVAEARASEVAADFQ